MTEKYFESLENLEILVDSFVDNYYIIIAEFTSNKKTKRLLLIENVKNPVLLELLLLANNDGYITFSKKHFSKVVPVKLRHKLAQKGICLTYATGMKITNRICFHRAVACLYFNCLNHEVHHIDKDIKNNHISNLVPLSKNLHKLIDGDPVNGKNLALDQQFYLLYKRYKKSQTVASNDDVIKNILDLKNNNYSIKDIAKKCKQYVKKSKIYEICSYFYYSKDFIKWLELQQNKGFSEFYGKYATCWHKLIQFERLIL